MTAPPADEGGALAIAFDWGERFVGPAPTCPVCKRCIGKLTWTPPYEVELELWSNTPSDVIFGPGYDVLVSTRFRALYEEYQLHGIRSFDEVRVVRSIRRRGKLKTLPTYWRAVVTFAETALDLEESEIERELSPGEQPCRHCRSHGLVKRWKRVVIEDGTFSGEDIAIPRGLFMYLVTPRVKAMCDQFHITNTHFVPIEQYGHDFYPWEHP